MINYPVAEALLLVILTDPLIVLAVLESSGVVGRATDVVLLSTATAAAEVMEAFLAVALVLVEEKEMRKIFSFFRLQTHDTQHILHGFDHDVLLHH